MIQELELQGKEARETIGTLEQRVAKIQEELRKIGNVSTSDENGQSQIAQRIRQLKAELQRCREHISQIQNAVREMEQEKARLQQQEEWQRSQKARAEQELASQKRRLQQYQGKLERLQQQMSILSSALGEYQQSMQVFQAQAAQQGQVTMQSVDSCIQCVELYMQYC